MTRPGRFCVRAAVLIGLCLVAVQCDNSPSSPSDEFLSGIWTGTLQSSISGPATALVTITLTQVGSSLTGTWSVDATSFAGANDGRLLGTVRGNIVEIDLTDPPNCVFSVLATVTDGNTISGTYNPFNCAVVPSGIISLTKATIAFQ